MRRFFASAAEKFGIVSKTHFVAALLFTLALIGFEILVFPQYYEAFHFGKYLHDGILIKPLKMGSLAFASYLLSFWLIFCGLASSYRYRAIYFCLFALSSLYEYSYQSLFRRFTTAEDIANAFFAADSRLIMSAVPQYVVDLAVIPCAAFVLVLLLVKPAAVNGKMMFATFLLAFISFFALTSYVTSNTYPTLSVNALYRSAIALPMNWYFGSLTQTALAGIYSEPRETVAYQSTSPPTNNLIFIVDESVRADHLSLNGYSRKTTPVLDDLFRKGYLINWGTAVASTTCSINSNNLLLTGVNELPDLKGDVYRYPSIFQYALAMGYKTFYFDGQTSNQWNGKRTDIPDFGTWVKATDLGQDALDQNDAEIARRVRSITANSTGNFIWINKFGVHPPYLASYPESEAVWQPAPRLSETSSIFADKRTSEELINTYDNAIVYNSTSFFSELFKDGVNANSVVVYTSDHGQNLGENGLTLSHCSTTRNEANVPLFMIAVPGTIPAADTGFRASHLNIFASMLDIMHFPEDRRLHDYSISLFKATARDSVPRYYFEGNLNARFSNGKYLFDR